MVCECCGNGSGTVHSAVFASVPIDQHRAYKKHVLIKTYLYLIKNSDSQQILHYTGENQVRLGYIFIQFDTIEYVNVSLFLINNLHEKQKDIQDEGE